MTAHSFAGIKCVSHWNGSVAAAANIRNARSEP